MGKETIEVERTVTHTEEEDIYLCDSCGTEIEEDQDMIVYEAADPWHHRGPGEYNPVYLHERSCAQNMSWVEPSDGPTVVGSSFYRNLGYHKIRAVLSYSSILSASVLGVIIALAPWAVLMWLVPSTRSISLVVLFVATFVTMVSTLLGVYLIGRDDKKVLVEENF